MKDLAPEARRLVAKVGKHDGPSLERRAAIARKLAERLGAAAVLGATQVAAATSGASAATVTAAGTSALSIVTALLVGMVAGGGAIGAYTLVTTSPTQGVPVASASAHTSHVDGPAHRSQKVELPAQAPSSPENVSDSPSAQLALPRAASAPASEVALNPTNSASRLSDEVRLLRAAQAELAAGHAAEALALVESHARSFPNGTLVEERQAARILALCAVGRRDEAVTQAQAFASAAPRSPLLPRLEQSCVAHRFGPSHSFENNSTDGATRRD